MRVLLVYPEIPDTFWGFKHALKFISRRATQPPLGLLTVASMLPEQWEKKLVDMNITKLRDKDIKEADLVFISAMSIQKTSALEVIACCTDAGVRTVGGGPLFTADYEEYIGKVDYLVLNEAELTLGPFLADMEKGAAKAIYRSEEYTDITATAEPLWELVDMGKYAMMNIQYSRGCPYDCEFCDIAVLFGHRVRTKTREQIISELASLLRWGWRGDVFFVDDNFIGNRTKLKREILPAIIAWMAENDNPFTFQTEVSIDLADDEELMEMMVRAGFNSVFVGIETTHEASLKECNKGHNCDRNMSDCVKSIHQSGLRVTAGFILGFDNDPPSIFEKITGFIQQSGIVSAMIGLLNAPRHTRLYQRLVQEGRLLNNGNGDNMGFSLNFKPMMDHGTLIQGYKNV
ncbi:MAG: B12-binding domain-containing radical SAM protein, partial [Planctomycetes bacterium]|nr:B12-binding domain-containing radical SAM protein [Planctomycetota bacterium]